MLRDHRCIPHAGLGPQGCLDFSRIDALPAYFDLIIAAADELDQPIVTLAYEVAGEQRAPRGAGAVSGEPPGNAAPILPFAAGYVAAVHDQFADFAGGNGAVRL